MYIYISIINHSHRSYKPTNLLRFLPPLQGTLMTSKAASDPTVPTMGPSTPCSSQEATGSASASETGNTCVVAGRNGDGKHVVDDTGLMMV